MQRYGSVIGVKKSKLAEYTRLHAAVWPAVRGMINRIAHLVRVVEDKR